KGLSEAPVLLRHVLRNAAVPIVTVIGFGVALLIGGVVVTESVFSIPGLGRLTVDAVLARDYPTVQAVGLLFSPAYVLIKPLLGPAYTPPHPRVPLFKPLARAASIGILADEAPEQTRVARFAARNKSVLIGSTVLAIIVLVGVLAPFLGTIDPAQINPAARNRTPGTETTVRNADGTQSHRTHWMGTDSLGRDVYSRVLYGARVSLIVGASVALMSAAAGLLIGLLTGYLRWLDGVVMRVMDGLMAIPAILLAIALMTLASAGLRTVVIAIVIPAIPGVVRLVRSVVLSIREEPYVEAAIALGVPTRA